MQMEEKKKKNIYVYTNLINKKTFSMASSTQRLKNCFHRIVGVESGYPRHAIVYILRADFGQNL